MRGASARPGGKGFEIGAGTGRFAAPSRDSNGDPDRPRPWQTCREEGHRGRQGRCQKLPFKDNEFDFALMVTTICFLDDLDLAFGEVRRMLKPGGSFIIGFVDKNSPLGKFYPVKAGQERLLQRRHVRFRR